MKIDNLKELQKVIKACRSLGVQSIKIDNVEFHLGDLPAPSQAQRTSQAVVQDVINTIAPGGITADTKILTDELTPDQLLFYSSVSNNDYDSQDQQ